MLMKQKLFSILALLLMAVSGAMAQDYYAPSTDEVIILNDVYDASKSGYSSHSAIAWGGSATVSMKTAGDPNNGGQPTSSTVNCYSVKGTGQGKNITLSITGVSKVIVYYKSDHNRYIELRDGSKNGNIIGSGQKETYYTEVELTATNKYSIFLHGTSTGSDDQDLYVYAIKLIAAPAATGYSITLDEGTGNKDSQNWEITPKSSELSGGEAVTVKYNGSREVKSVTVVKKAAPAPDPIALSAVTADNIGGVVCSDGYVYPAKTAAPSGKTAVGILGKVTATGHGLILALEDAAQQNWNTINGWTSVTTYASTTLKVLPKTNLDAWGNLSSYAKLGDTTVSDWAVAQKSDYDAIFTNLGSKTGDSDGTTYDSNVNAYITTGVGGTAISGEYWSATMVDDNLAWYFSGSWWNYQGFKEDSRGVRPVLGF